MRNGVLNGMRNGVRNGMLNGMLNGVRNGMLNSMLNGMPMPCSLSSAKAAVLNPTCCERRVSIARKLAEQHPIERQCIRPQALISR
jgi:hypothetical protein